MHVVVFILFIITKAPLVKPFHFDKEIYLYCTQHNIINRAKIKIFVCKYGHHHFLYIHNLKCPHPFIKIYFIKDPPYEIFKGYYHDLKARKGVIFSLSVLEYKPTILIYKKERRKKCL